MKKDEKPEPSGRPRTDEDYSVKERDPWHRLIGLTITDIFYGSKFNVEFEKDLSVQKQLLDVVIIERRAGNDAAPENLPAGLEDPGPHNLITYKSHREALDGWAVEELCGHYVNYRKQISPSQQQLIPEEDFRLYAVSTGFPEKLSKHVDLKLAEEGVYDVRWGIRNIRVIVLSRIEESEKNAPWLMFSAVPDKVRFGTEHYRWKMPVSGIINRLFMKYQTEGVEMPYTVKDFQEEMKDEILKTLTPEDILKRFDPEEIFKRFKTEDRLKGLKPEDRLKGLRPEEIEKYLKKIRRESHE